MRTLKDYILLYLKGVAMGSADVVPGVSGGTVAFISGIYEELVRSIRSFDADALRLLFRGDIRNLWQHINGLFLTVLLAGIMTAFLSFARVILYLLKNHPEMLWAFFFGLIIASAIVVGRTVGRWNLPVILSGIAGALLGYYVTVTAPGETTTALWFVFLSGMIAICAMILPGISGSFILVLMGKYEYLLTALKNLNFPVIIVFVSGAVIGLLSFSHLLNWTLRRYRDITIAVLTGIMIGSLNKVWPWKEVVETYTSHKGEIRPLIEQNIWPANYLELTGRDPCLMYALGLAIIGFVLVYFLGKISDESSADAKNKLAGDC